jgi:hypothetical protein
MMNQIHYLAETAFCLRPSSDCVAASPQGQGRLAGKWRSSMLTALLKHDFAMHVMLDLEAMGKGHRAAIVSMGAVVFDISSGDILAEFSATLDFRDAAKFGEIDTDTVMWWLRQSEAARQSLNGGNEKLAAALHRLRDWDAADWERARVWGNGVGFDCVILKNAFDATGIECPWKFWNERDVRTVVEMGRQLLSFDPKRDMPLDGVAHNALDDARHQAKYVSAIWRQLAEK